MGVDYKGYPIVNEAALETLLNIYACGGGIVARPEVHNAFGRSDLEFLAGKRYFVFELKLLHEGEDADERLQEAINQIKSRHYGEGYHEGDVLVRMALVFSPEKKMIVAHNVESIALEL